MTKCQFEQLGCFLQLLFGKDMTVYDHTTFNTPDLIWETYDNWSKLLTFMWKYSASFIMTAMRKPKNYPGAFQARAVEAPLGIASHSWLYCLANVGLFLHCVVPTKRLLLSAKQNNVVASKVGLQNYSLLVLATQNNFFWRRFNYWSGGLHWNIPYIEMSICIPTYVSKHV